MRRSHEVLAVLAALASGPAAWPQTSMSTGIEADLPSMQLPAAPALPSLVLREVAQIALPGPLAGEGPSLAGERLAVRVARGLALASPVTGAQVELAPDPAPGDPGAWIESPGGRLRFRFEPNGRIVAHKRCSRCASGWRKQWRLRVAGGAVVPPLAFSDRVCFGTLENRVYCVKDKNGHQLWAVDVGGRVSSPLVRWSGTVEAETRSGEDSGPPVAIEAILVAPDGGSELLALAAASGQKLAGVQVATEGDRLVGAPAVTADGEVAVARQGYRPADASLAVYRLFLAPAAPPKSTAGKPISAPRSAAGPP